jgi:hypothetical protein
LQSVAPSSQLEKESRDRVEQKTRGKESTGERRRKLKEEKKEGERRRKKEEKKKEKKGWWRTRTETSFPFNTCNDNHLTFALLIIAILPAASHRFKRFFKSAQGSNEYVGYT